MLIVAKKTKFYAQSEQKEVKGSKSFSSLFGGKFGGPDTVETISNKLNKIMCETQNTNRE